ncbi:MAG TPA: hypothetical protein VH186_16615 [Chloroflexia bacterium]|nr:hypothetical protein [Chloroflexia bacterium]
MATINLDTPLLDGGISSINFFNGRLLSGQDLDQEQAANHAGRRQLGKALGGGIVYGLEVEPSPGQGDSVAVKVYAGLAFNRKGEAVYLPEDSVVSLQAATPQVAPQAGLFEECLSRTTGSGGLRANSGLYLLLIAPTSGYQGRAQTSGLAESPATGFACGSGYKVEGVRFSLVPLIFDPAIPLEGVSSDTLQSLNTLSQSNAPEDISKLRNWLAHLFFGTEARQQGAEGLGGKFAKKNLYRPAYAHDTLYRLAGLNDCEVPLALLYWLPGGLEYIDLGAVRRRPLPPGLGDWWPLPNSTGYPALGEACLLQFQEQLADLFAPKFSPGVLNALQATNYFRYLPAAGIIPLSPLTPTSAGRGINYLNFFQGLACHSPLYIQAAQVEALLQESLAYPPVDLEGEVMFWLYLVRQEGQTNLNNLPPYMLFASGALPARGEARYNQARWNFSYYSQGVSLA